MRGVVLAGGTGSRLLPLTKVTNKHLLPVGREPMIFHPIKKLVQVGITDILVVTGAEHCGDMIATLGSGRDIGCDLTYRVQDRAGGIGEALGLADGFGRRDNVCVILGDNVFQDPLAAHLAAYDGGARVLLKEVDDPERFGVAEVRGDKVVSIVEKPAKPASRLAVTGVYFYDQFVYEVIKKIEPSPRGEIEITDVNNVYLQADRLSYGVMSGWWTDAGTHESLARANALVQGDG